MLVRRLTLVNKCNLLAYFKLSIILFWIVLGRPKTVYKAAKQNRMHAVILLYTCNFSFTCYMYLLKLSVC